MNEDFLVYVWRYKLFNDFNFETSKGKLLEIITPGLRNFDSGPDFFNAKIKIDSQLWAGNVEIHVNSSDWYKHKHQFDDSYSSVILHVVYNHDKEVEVENKNINRVILPVLELKNHISSDVIEAYEKLSTNKKSFMHCSKQYVFKKDFEYDNWIESLYIKRLSEKTNDIINQLNVSISDWEQVFFRSLAKAFGLKLNGLAFQNLSSSFSFNIIGKNFNNSKTIEALFFGQAGFLEDEISEEYYNTIKNEYRFLQSKYQITPINNSQFKFFRTRPTNFPTIRLAQLAAIYTNKSNLFSKIIDIDNLYDLKNIFNVEINEFWDTHFTFNKASKPSKKRMTDKFIDLLIINCVIPIRFIYFKSIDDASKLEETLMFSESLKSEKNTIVTEFERNNWMIVNAKESQAIMQLKKDLCDKHKCLSCLIGKRLLR